MKVLKNKINKFLQLFKHQNFSLGYSSLIGASCINFILGAIYSLCTLSVYEISYIKGRGGKIDIESLTFYFPIEYFFQCISAIISGIIYKTVGLHKTNLIGVSFLSAGYFLMYLSRSLTADLFSMMFCGVGTGIIYYPSTANIFEWFKDNNGLISGIMETMISLGSFFFASLGEYAINPDKKNSRDFDSLYDFEIAIRIKKFLLILQLSVIISFIISYFMMYEKKLIIKEPESTVNSQLISLEKKLVKKSKNNLEEPNIQENKIDKQIENNNPSLNINDNNNIPNKINNNLMKEEINKKNKDNISNKEPKLELEKNEKLDSKNEPNNLNNKTLVDEPFEKKTNFTEMIELPKDEVLQVKKKDMNNNKCFNNIKILKNCMNFCNLLKLSLQSKRLIIFIFVSILQSPVSNMAFTLYREIGEHKKIDIKYLQLIGSLYFIFECSSSFIFGMISDYLKLKYLFIIMNSILVLIGFIYCLSINNGLAFFLVQSIISFMAGGYYPIKDCYLIRVFGENMYVELSGLVSFFISIFVSILTPLSYCVISEINNKNLAYWILFVSYGLLNLLGLIMSFSLNETKANISNIQKEV